MTTIEEQGMALSEKDQMYLDKLSKEVAVFSGTSMACPSVLGVAALVWSQMPELSASDLKARLMGTARSRAGLSVRLPSDQTKDVPFETLSITGGIADAFRALTQ